MLSGGFLEHDNIRGAGDLIVHPTGEGHADRFGPSGALCLNLQTEAVRGRESPAYWRVDAETPLKAAIAEIEPQLANADVVPLVEQVLGRKLDTGEIRVVDARYCRPHGIRVTGDRFLTDPTYPKDRVLAIVIYILMKQENFLESGLDYTSFLDRMITEGSRPARSRPWSPRRCGTRP